jgi:hypothetical protein
MLALVEIVQQVRLLSLLARGDRLAVTVKGQCLAALDGHYIEASAFLAKLLEVELSRPEMVVGAVWQIQQAAQFVESTSLLDNGLISLRDGVEPARGVRLPYRGEFAVACGNAARIGLAPVTGANFWSLPDGLHLSPRWQLQQTCADLVSPCQILQSLRQQR